MGCGPHPASHSMGHQGLFLRRLSGCCVMRSTHHLVPRVILNGAISPLPPVPSWRAQGRLYFYFSILSPSFFVFLFHLGISTGFLHQNPVDVLHSFHITYSWCMRSNLHHWNIIDMSPFPRYQLWRILNLSLRYVGKLVCVVSNIDRDILYTSHRQCLTSIGTVEQVARRVTLQTFPKLLLHEGWKN
jgi:hypothetical protein